MPEKENTDAALEVSDQKEYNRYLINEPIAEFAKYAGIDIDEAVNRRVAAAIENTPPKMDISVRPIEPQGNLYGFASVTVGGIRIDDFKIVTNKEGDLFVGMPSKPDKTNSTGYRNTVFVDKDFKDDFNTAIIGKYKAAIQAHSREDKPERITDQVAKAQKDADKHNSKLSPKIKSTKEKGDRE